MTMTTELHLRYADGEDHPINGQVIAHFHSHCTEVDVHAPTGSINISLDEMRTLMDAFMEIDRIHKINQKTKGE